MTQRILFVDDEAHVLKGYERSLRGQRAMWSMDFEACPRTALERIRSTPYDTVVSDMRMPHMTGLDLLRHIKQDALLSDLPVVIVTGDDDASLKRSALDLDAADLLNKPIVTEDLIARLKSSLRTKRYADELKQTNALLEQRVQERTAELAASRIDIIWRLGKAAEYRDEETGNHVIRVGCYSHAIARAMGMDDEFCHTLFLAAPLHDIGKIGIPDVILLKQGKLTPDEWDLMRCHCEIGASILRGRSKLTPIASKYGCRLAGMAHESAHNPVIAMAAVIAGSHHEKWDGTGYPMGLAGDEIPLVGRIVAVADVFDALRSQRPYKQSMSVDRALEILDQDTGTHFDPQVAAAFHDALPEVLRIDSEFRDEMQPCSSAH